MASPFQRYQGEQVQQIPAGYLEAMGQGARSIGAGIASFGESVAKGIEKYSQNKMLSEAADEKLQGAIQHFGMMADAYKDHPEFGELAQTYSKAQEDAAKALTGSLGKKQGSLARLELIDKSAQQFVAATTAKHQALALAAYENTPEKQQKEAEGLLAQHGYVPGTPATLEKALSKLAATIDKNNKEQNVGPGQMGYTDPNKALGDLLGRARGAIKQGLSQDPKNLTLLNAEQELAGAIERFSGQRDVLGAMRTGDIMGIGKGIARFAKGGWQQSGAMLAMEPTIDPMTLPYGAGATDFSARDQLTLGGTNDMSATPAERARAKAIENLTPEQEAALAERDVQIDRLAMSREGQNLSRYNQDVDVSKGLEYYLEMLKKGESIGPTDRQRAFGRVVGIDKAGDEKGKYVKYQTYINNYERDVRSGIQVSPEDTAFYERAKAYVADPKNVPRREDRRYMGAFDIARGARGNVTEFDEIEDKYRERINELFRPHVGFIDTPENRAKRQKLERELKAEIDKRRDVKGKLEDVSRQKVAEELYPEMAFADKRAPRVDLAVAGKRVYEAPVTQEERYALAKDALAKSQYVQTRFGGKIPTSALQALQSKLTAPPAMVTDPATGARLYQSAPGRWEQLKVEKPEAGTQVNMPLFSPDHKSIQNGRQPQYVIQGNFKGGGADKQSDFVAVTQKRARALTSIQRLLEINEKPGEGLRPELIGEAQTIVNEIISSNRVDLIGPGQVAVAEWQMLEKLVRDPTKLLELDSVTKANLVRLMQRMEDVMYDEAYSKGLTLTPAVSGAQIGSQMRMQNLVNR